MRKILPSSGSPNASREPTFGAQKPRQSVTNRVGGRSRPLASPIVRIRQSSASTNVSTPSSAPSGQSAGASSCGVGPSVLWSVEVVPCVVAGAGLALVVVVSQPRTESASANPSDHEHQADNARS